MKFEAPPQYSAFGKNLAKWRRDNAEDGKAHQTARKLGALFELLIPNVPRLVDAYGKRVSEIIKMPGVNP
jgi:hypothetical protein